MLKVLILTIAFTSVICTGSYEVIDIDEYFSQQSNDEIYAAARLKLDQTIPQDFQFLKVESIERQIVAGFNYKFFITFKNEQSIHLYMIRIYQDLQNNLQVYEPELINQKEYL
ncbi:unnamed protein product [Paramecium primaurelia]|uniref:Cystatin domain-containing protein n=1 Tax=Paramecium primaurelia TaxID=5886 RepID=A0A8S1K317_PARPR|nr:unnamed protein product [Paramecium primaurelia]